MPLLALAGGLVLSACVHEPEPDLWHHGDSYAIPPKELPRVIEAARRGDLGAAERLGLYYDICLHDVTQATPWVRQLVASGSPDAMVWMARILFYDDADPSNDQEAIDLMKEAIRLGLVEEADHLRQMEEEKAKTANQALQTTPMTRSVYEKTIEFGRSQRGV